MNEHRPCDAVPVRQNNWRSVPPPARPLRVSVVVARYQQQGDLDRLLAALGAQRWPVDIVEVIAAGDGSHLSPKVPAAIDKIPVVLVRQPDRGFRPGSARNLAAERASGDVLVFFDADTIPGLGTVAQLAALPGVVPDALVVGRRHHDDLDRLTPADMVEWLHRQAGDAEQEVGLTSFDDPPWLRDFNARTDDMRSSTIVPTKA